jgi:hypothetical protein
MKVSRKRRRRGGEEKDEGTNSVNAGGWAREVD